MAIRGLVQSSVAPIAGQRVVVTGAAGQLGSYLMRALADAGATSIGLGHQPGLEGVRPVDITDGQAVAHAMGNARPDVIVHAAAMTNVDGCEREPEMANRVNHIGARNVA